MSKRRKTRSGKGKRRKKRKSGNRSTKGIMSWTKILNHGCFGGK